MIDYNKYKFGKVNFNKEDSHEKDLLLFSFDEVEEMIKKKTHKVARSNWLMGFITGTGLGIVLVRLVDLFFKH